MSLDLYTINTLVHSINRIDYTYCSFYVNLSSLYSDKKTEKAEAGELRMLSNKQQKIKKKLDLNLVKIISTANIFMISFLFRSHLHLNKEHS